MARRYWLFKSEPDLFSFDDLKKEKDQTAYWDGVRNYQARNMLRDEIKKGDGVLFYHSRVNPQVIAGTAKVVRAGYPDPEQFNKKSKYFDAKSPQDNPRWYAVDVQADRTFKNEVSLKALKEIPELKDMVLLKKGMRLSIQPVSSEEWKVILKLGGKLKNS